MAEYDLPPGPAELFEAVREAFGEHLGGEHHLRLGGGTALAARWAHRHSTDVDFFTDRASYDRLWERRDAFRRAIERSTRGPPELSIRPANTKIVLPDGEITLFTTPTWTDQPRSADSVRGTRVPLETSAEILAKKLTGRMLDSRTLLARDLYDFAVARHRDPAAAKTAMKNIDTSALRQLRRELRDLAQGWVQHPSQRALLRPAFPAEARNPAPSVAAQVLQEILSRTPDHPRRVPLAPER